jgi:hypothetical protein
MHIQVNFIGVHSRSEHFSMVILQSAKSAILHGYHHRSSFLQFKADNTVVDVAIFMQLSVNNRFYTAVISPQHREQGLPGHDHGRLSTTPSFTNPSIKVQALADRPVQQTLILALFCLN